MRKFLDNYPIHTFLFITFVSFFLYAQNPDKISLYMTYRTIFVGTIFSIIIYSLLFLILKHKIKSGIIATCFLLILFNYGVTYDFLEKMYFNGYWPFLNIHRYLIGLVILLFVVIYWIVSKKIITGNKTNFFLNTLIILLLLFNSAKIILIKLQSSHPVESIISIPVHKDFKHKLPNLYYFILDGYANEHVLLKYYHYDNSEFINFLKSKDFYDADSASSNYYSTLPSLSSTFNLNYHSEKDDKVFVNKMNNNILFRILKDYGYKIYTMKSGYTVTGNFTSTDSIIKINAPNEFERSVLRYTICRIDDLFGFMQAAVIKSQVSKLESVANLSHSQRFVFVHIVAPHPPFVFDENGNQIYNKKSGNNSWEPKQSYIAQLSYLNKVATKYINQIIANDSSAAIIIQSDHGPWITSSKQEDLFEARSRILNAIRLPKPFSTSNLYPTITSVNTFRYFLKQVINPNFLLLKDSLDGKGMIMNSFSFKKRIQ